jgi:hypothetical protein
VIWRSHHGSRLFPALVSLRLSQTKMLDCVESALVVVLGRKTLTCISTRRGMNRLVQDAMHTWLLDSKDFSTILDRFVHHLCICLSTGHHENWLVCHIFFPHAKVAAEYTPTNKEAPQEWATTVYKSAWYAREQVNFPGALKMATASIEVRIEKDSRTRYIRARLPWSSLVLQVTAL